MEYQIERVERLEQPTAVVLGQVPEVGIAEFLGGVFGEVIGALSAQGLAPAGAPFGIYSPPSKEGFRIEAGFPCSGPVAPTGRVAPSTLPAGEVLRVTHRGPYQDVAAAYQAMEAFMVEHGLVPAGPPWESYLDDPEVEVPRTVVEWPVRSA